MSKQPKKTPASADDESKTLGVEDIPGAVSPEDAEAETAATGDGDAASLRERLARFRERRAEQPAASSGPNRAGPRLRGTRPGGGGGAGGGRFGAGARRGAAGAGGAGGARRGRAARAGGGLGAGPGAGRRRGAGADAGDDHIGKGRQVIQQLGARLRADADDPDVQDKRRPLQQALRTIARGYRALEDEVARLNAELDETYAVIDELSDD